jgi:hypothetical protein
MNDEAEQHLIYLRARNSKFEECAANIQLAIGEMPEDGRYCEALHKQVGAAAFSAYAIAYDAGIGRLSEEYRRGQLDSYWFFTAAVREQRAIGAGNLVNQYKECGAIDGYSWGLSLIPEAERAGLLEGTGSPD